MSDHVHCERCRVEGRRRRGQIAPEGWSYAEFEDDDSGDTLYVYACSEQCQKVPWKQGPGRLESPVAEPQFLTVIVDRGGQQKNIVILVSNGDRVCFGRHSVQIVDGALQRVYED